MSYECNEFDDDFCFYLDQVKNIIESAYTPYILEWVISMQILNLVLFLDQN